MPRAKLAYNQSHEVKPSGRLFILSGPSGVGKDAVIKRLKTERFPMHFTVTATTRHIRPGETDGEDYLFLTKQQFDEMAARGGFLEHVNLYGHCYGTPKQQVLEALTGGRDVLLKIDTQGAETIKTAMPDAIRIFLAPSSLAELERRLIDRSTESPEALERRIRNIEAEMACAGAYDYVVYNRDEQLGAAVKQIKRIIGDTRRRR
ncbi:MAG: guanylate kinase [Chloroflexota bacterium]|nr:guanylate kinase [Chloroflexota bacterium]